jgi:hypothetical protein
MLPFTLFCSLANTHDEHTQTTKAATPQRVLASILTPFGLLQRSLKKADVLKIS